MGIGDEELMSLIIVLASVIYLVQHLNNKKKIAAIEVCANRAFCEGKRIGELHASRAFERAHEKIKVEKDNNPGRRGMIYYQMTAFDDLNMPYMDFATKEEIKAITPISAWRNI